MSAVDQLPKAKEEPESTGSNLKISLPPNEILLNVVHAFNGKVNDLARNVDVMTTSNKALSHVTSLLQSRDKPIMLTRMRTRTQQRKIEELANQMFEPGPSSGPLTIRNAIPANQLPSPPRATQKERQKLKENFLKATKFNEPYAMTRVMLEDGKLPTISGSLRFSPIEVGEADLNVHVENDHCLFDSGAQYCSISADIINAADPDFLRAAIHDKHRWSNEISVTVEGAFRLTNTAFTMCSVFLVIPTSTIPNKRVGVILGQHSFLDRLDVRSIPRLILQQRGEVVQDNEWGDVHIKAKINLDDDKLVELS